jgi:hypothetical protein
VRKKHEIPLLATALEDRLEFRTSLGHGKGVTEACGAEPGRQGAEKLYGALSRWDATVRQEPQGGGSMRKRKPQQIRAVERNAPARGMEAVSGVERKKPAPAARASEKGRAGRKAS